MTSPNTQGSDNVGERRRLRPLTRVWLPWLGTVACVLLTRRASGAELSAAESHARDAATPAAEGPDPNEPSASAATHGLRSPPAVRAPVLPFEWRLGVFSESAVGVSGPFYNHLLGLRLDHRFTDTVSFGAALGYANLKGPDGRAHNVLPEFVLEYRPTLNESGSWALPLRLTSGYLPENGPVLQGSAGLSAKLADRTELVFDLLAPTLWITNDRAEYSMNFGLELAFAY